MVTILSLPSPPNQPPHPTTKGLISDTVEDPPKLCASPTASSYSDCFKPTSYRRLNILIFTPAHRMPPLIFQCTLKHTLETTKKKFIFS